MAPSSTLRLGGVPEHFNLPWHWAMASAELSDLELVWEDQPGGTGQMLSGLEDGSLDLVSILTEGTVAAIDKGLDASIVAVYVESPLQWGVFTPAASPYNDEADMEGARIAISRFRSGSHLMAFIQAERHGWTINNEQFVLTGGLAGARESFAKGESDLFLWDQFMTRPLVEAGEFQQIGVQRTPWPSFVFAARNEVLTGRTTEIGRIIDAVVAQANELHDRDGIVDELASTYKLTPAIAQAWLDSVSFAGRGPLDPELAPTVLETLRRANFS